MDVEGNINAAAERVGCNHVDAVAVALQDARRADAGTYRQLLHEPNHV